jgi:hypothetical protein
MPSLPSRPPRGLAALITAVTALSLAACGGSSSEAPKSTATGTFLPASGDLGTTQTVVVLFSASMRTTGVTVGGSMGANALSGWTTTAVANDTLILTPSAPWATGAGTLTVMAADAAGLSLPATLQASYTVAPTATCGASAGDCNNPTDCAFTMVQLANWTRDCYLVSPAGTPACVEGKGATAACSNCITDVALCAVGSCLVECVGGFSSATCTACLARSCTAAMACLGRTL